MNGINKCTFIGFALLWFTQSVLSQVNTSKALVFSAVAGTLSKEKTIILSEKPAALKWIKGDSSFFKVSMSNKQVRIAFQPSRGFAGIVVARVQMRNAAGKPILNMDLTGLGAKGLEGENEPPLSDIVDALGYSIRTGWTSLSNHSLPQLQGDEVSSAVFRKAGKGNVEMIPVARYSPDFKLLFGYYTQENEKANTHQVGILSEAGQFPEHQSLYPSVSSGGNSFDPGNSNFGFYATSATHTAYSEDVWNMLLYPDNAVHATRIYQLKDKAGKVINNNYLVCFEEAKNGDYNDYVFVVKNITPATKDPFVKLFNGTDLAGWNTFLSNIGTNKDPNSNFRVEDGVLHVVGKDVGYAITQKGFRNYHFKVDFKWGEKKWPPRLNDKRDAGICYNIPLNEIDSVWPKSIECQVQEGDVGDFWLIGFPTIKVKGVQSKAAAYTRITKYADAEKPYGEWNTVEVISYNGKCVHIVNGVVVNVGEDASLKEGRILLQSEWAEVYYRNAALRKL